MSYIGEKLNPQRGGTGVANSVGSTLTLGGSLETSGAFDSVFTITGATSVTFPTSGTLATTSDIPSFPLSTSNGGTGLSSAGTDGNVLTASGGVWTSAAPAYAGTSWSVITANQTAVVNEGYICNKASTLVLSLPTTSSVGDIIEVTGINTALGWQIDYTTNQQVFFGASSATITTGTLTSSAIRDSIKLVCIIEDLTWNVISSVGNITIT